jgi:hypothetical protein
MGYFFDYPITQPVPVRELAEATARERGVVVEPPTPESHQAMNSVIRSVLPADDDEDRGE